MATFGWPRMVTFLRELARTLLRCTALFMNEPLEVSPSTVSWLRRSAERPVNEMLVKVRFWILVNEPVTLTP